MKDIEFESKLVDNDALNLLRNKLDFGNLKKKLEIENRKENKR